MLYQLYDCLSDTVVKTESDKAETDRQCEQHGGNTNCFYVFEKAEPVKVETSVKEIENKPLAGMLF
jgi:hypothetical protein